MLTKMFPIYRLVNENFSFSANSSDLLFIFAINQNILNYILYLLSNDDDSVLKQIFLMPLDLYSSGKSSFYSNLVRISEFYNLPDFDPLFIVTDAKIYHYLKLMQQQYLLHRQHTLQH